LTLFNWDLVVLAYHHRDTAVSHIPPQAAGDTCKPTNVEKSTKGKGLQAVWNVSKDPAILAYQCSTSKTVERGF
jgi:hypothetical protein